MLTVWWGKKPFSFLFNQKKTEYFLFIEILPGLEDFLRSMLSSTHLDTDHRQIAAMYLDKLDQHSQSINQQSSYIDDQSL
jgi:hypothetical protein